MHSYSPPSQLFTFIDIASFTGFAFTYRNLNTFICVLGPGTYATIEYPLSILTCNDSPIGSDAFLRWLAPRARVGDYDLVSICDRFFDGLEERDF